MSAVKSAATPRQKSLDFAAHARATRRQQARTATANGSRRGERRSQWPCADGAASNEARRCRPPSTTAAASAAATAESMATKQRDISVSEFFAKNRHLLGFDNPAQGAADDRQGSGRQLARRLRRSGHRAGDLGRDRSDRQQPLQGQRAGQRPGHRQKADPADLRQAALRQQVPSPADEPRPARASASAPPACTACSRPASR